MKKQIDHHISEQGNGETSFNPSHFQIAFEFAAVGMALTSLDGHLFKVNPVFCSMLGYSETEILKMTLQDITHPEEYEIFEGSVKRLLSGKIKTFQMEKRYLHKSREVIWVLLSMVVVHNFQKMPSYMISQIQNISDRKKNEEALRQSEERYRLLVENAPLCIHEIDMEGCLRSMNKAGLKMMGIEKEHEICGLKYLDVVDDNDLERVRTLLDHAYSGMPSLFEYKAISSTGTRCFDSCFIPIKDKRNKVFRLMGVTQDITERKQAEEERLKLERQMLHKQKLESLGLLAGGIAHDFNNILTSILGYSDLAMEDMPEDSVTRTYLDEVVKGSRQAAGLIQQMLAYSGKGTFSSEPINLSHMIQEMSRLLEISISKKCRLKYEFSPNLPLIQGDEAQIRQIIMNLIINASESIGEKSGQINVSTGTVLCDQEYLLKTFFGKELPEGPYHYLNVSDTGEGMSDEIKTNIFDPFFTTKQTGHGLGLSAVLGIVRGHHGTISLKSEEGKGTTFEVFFPILEQSLSSEIPEKSVAARWQGKGVALVVDDELAIRKLAKIMLEKLGFTVITAKDGKEGVELFKKSMNTIDIVLLDMNMPHLNGEKTFNEIRRLNRSVKAVLSSGYNEQATTDRLTARGLAGFIKKPYCFDELRGIVKKVIENE